MQTQRLWRPYTQMLTAAPPLEAVATEGVRIRLADGRELVDGVSSWWTACHGYNHPHIRSAVIRQLEAMPHVMFGGFTHFPAERLAERLCGLLPAGLNHIFFCDSGSVAVEAAMKMAVQHHLNSGRPGRTRFLAFRGGYHGDTLGAMSVCDPEEGMHSHFSGWIPQQIFSCLPDNDDRAAAFEALIAHHRSELAAVIIEPLIQGAGGMRVHAPATLARVCEAARRQGVLVIADEIFTGFGRTGSLFACEQAKVAPDILCVSKALTGGVLGLAAVAASTTVFSSFLSQDPAKALMHGPTFMANPLACAAANASLDLFESEPRVEQAQAMAAKLLDGLGPCRGLGGVVDVRALGAVGVVQFDRPVDREALKRAFVEKGVWVRPFGDIVYLAPALNIADGDLEGLCTAVVSVLKDAQDRGLAREGRA